ncbi:hypothetical protein LOCC1_G004300 [Lachnellula occidentalis]|uniref:Peptidase A1 domain-containing protein n=1 Tax=Lachnellula occidentalis TaxID=215460 RepID=A0A8H8RQM2_9HELO|nr:hypothetical protein LOCC1_G004300 [Lachnellula occidentalis]
MASLLLSLFAFSLFKIAYAAAPAGPIPRSVTWAPKSYGVEGPWWAVRTQLGTPPQIIDLLPGGSFQSVVLGSEVCGGTSCDAQTAGLYNSDASSTAFTQTGPPSVTNGTNFMTRGINYTFVFDTMSPVTNIEGAPDVHIPSFDMVVWTAGSNEFPGGSKYGLQIGNLALGATDINQSWPNDGEPRANGTLVPSFLFDAGITPSNSYGLHVGSVAMGIPPSLYFGGYEQSRVLGLVTAQDYGLNFLPIDLLDISIGVAVGNSPFDFSSKAGLLASGNASIGPALQVHVDYNPPYISLPRSTCDAIAAELPVHFEPSLGLYLWNTTNPNYTTIVTSPSFLGFTFRLNASISQNMTINVPFSLLNLTLTPPAVTQPTAYLPCSPLSDNGQPNLGRAFAQAAFVGVNWQTDGQGTWFMAQAPGPNTPSAPEGVATSLQAFDRFIVPSSNDWVDTWKLTWKPIGADTVHVNSSTPGVTVSPSPKSTSAPSSPISPGAIAGIAIGAICGVVLIGTGVWYIIRRAKRSRRGTGSSFNMLSPRQDPPIAMYHGYKRDGGFGPQEVHGSSAPGAQQMPTPQTKYYHREELQGDHEHPPKRNTRYTREGFPGEHAYELQSQEL